MNTEDKMLRTLRLVELTGLWYNTIRASVTRTGTKWIQVDWITGTTIRRHWRSTMAGDQSWRRRATWIDSRRHHHHRHRCRWHPPSPDSTLHRRRRRKPTTPMLAPSTRGPARSRSAWAPWATHPYRCFHSPSAAAAAADSGDERTDAQRTVSSPGTSALPRDSPPLVAASCCMYHWAWSTSYKCRWTHWSLFPRHQTRIQSPQP